MKPPKKSHVPMDHILVEQFLRKGYTLKAIEEDDATTIILTHEKKCAHALRHEEMKTGLQLAYKNLIKVS